MDHDGAMQMLKAIAKAFDVLEDPNDRIARRVGLC